MYIFILYVFYKFTYNVNIVFLLYRITFHLLKYVIVPMVVFTYNYYFCKGLGSNFVVYIKVRYMADVCEHTEERGLVIILLLW